MKKLFKKNLVYAFFKRVIDFFLGLIFLIFLSPIFLIIASIIYLDSKGPIFYMPIRTGLFNKKFRIIKFRSMNVDADLGPDTTSRNDKRITRVGRFLRKFKLDEIPQLINVIKGEMSFVGPRPELPKYTDQYNSEEKLILSVIPGITDYSSIYYSKFNELVEDDNPDYYFEKYIFSNKNKLRLKYVKDRKFIIDLFIFIKTIIVIFKNQFN